MIWRPAARKDLSLAGLWTLGACCALASLPLLPFLARMAGPCPLRTLAGIPCFTCGATRAASALAQGDVVLALATNPLAALAIVAGVLGGPLAPAWVFLRGPIPTVQPGLGTRLGVLAILLANWAYLIARGV